MPRSPRSLTTALLSTLCLVLLTVPGSLFAQADELPKFTFNGQFRLRGEADGRTVGVDPDFGVLSRVRAGVRGDLVDWLGVYVQLQDARLWGTEFNTLLDAGADNFDMHQGYADLGSTEKFIARLGRQEMAIADERLIGSVGWSNTGRSFDGAQLFGRTGDISWKVWAYNVAERDSVLVIGLNPQLNQGVFDDGLLIGGFASATTGPVVSELTLIYDRDALTERSYTANLRLRGNAGIVFYDGAGAYQFGPSRGAWFASGKVGVALSKGTFAAQVDYLSGDDDPDTGDIKAFQTLYATNHKFYGYMDYILAPFFQLDQAGLVDAILRATWVTTPSTQLRLDLHRFATAQKRNDQRSLGTEIDLVGNWRIVPIASLQLGFAVFVPEELATVLLPAFSGGEKTTWWGYAMFTVNWR